MTNNNIQINKWNNFSFNNYNQLITDNVIKSSLNSFKKYLFVFENKFFAQSQL